MCGSGVLRLIPRFTVVLDANVLYAIPLLDCSIRLAQRDVCAVRWTGAILEEAQRNLIAHRGDEERIRRRFKALRDHFGDWEITGYEDLIPVMRCDEKDRHVLAAAIRGTANQIVTANVTDFPAASLAPYDIDVVTPDDFFLNALHMHQSETVSVLHEQASALRRPAMTVQTLLSGLARCGASQFAKEAADVIAATR